MPKKWKWFTPRDSWPRRKFGPKNHDPVENQVLKIMTPLLQIFLSSAELDEFLDDYEAAVPEAQSVNIKFFDLVDVIKKRYTPT